VTVWAQVFLGVIALATLTTAIVQLAVLVAASRLARRVERLADQFERELAPTFTHINAISRDASRAVAIATAQIERADRLLNELSQRVEETVNVVQKTIVGPVREGMALLAAFRTGLGVVREARRHTRARQRAEDEEALFI